VISFERQILMMMKKNRLKIEKHTVNKQLISVLENIGDCW
jgi:hypothetical protein